MITPTPLDAQQARALVTNACAALGHQFAGPVATDLLVAIGYQESAFETRIQLGGGPGRGFWQMGTSTVADLFAIPATRTFMLRVCEGVPDAYARLTQDDTFAATLARLLLWADPRPLPVTQSAGWAYYVDVWRPGAPRPDAWTESWEFAHD